MPMSEREDIVFDLKGQIRWIENIEAHKLPGWADVTGAMRRAVDYLERQEQRKPIAPVGYYVGDMIYYRCAVCRNDVHRWQCHCDKCGRAVDWDGDDV